MSKSFSFVSAAEIEDELAVAPKQPAFEIQNGYPLCALSDRQFECLLHDIFSNEIQKGNTDFGTFDQALLMRGTGDRGRDCALLLGGAHVGVIQCKRYEQLLTAPEAAREIIKFCLHAILDPELISEPGAFVYLFATSKDFNEKAKLLLGSFKTRIGREPKLADWVKEVIDESKSFAKMVQAHIMPRLVEILTAIDVRQLGFNELNTLLVNNEAVVHKYFVVKKVVHEERVAAMEQTLNTVANAILDEDVRRLVDRLQRWPRSHRFSAGICSLWGYPQEFVNHILTTGQLGSSMMLLGIAKTEFEGLFLEFLRHRISQEILLRITAAGTFAPFTIQAAEPYIFAKLAERWRRTQQGRTLSAVLPAPSLAGDPLTIRTRLLGVGEAVLRGDFSGLVGDQDLVALKKKILRHVHAQFHSVAEMEVTFDKEWPSMMPICDEIERMLEPMLVDRTTIVLEGMDWFDDERHVRRVLDAFGGTPQ